MFIETLLLLFICDTHTLSSLLYKTSNSELNSSSVNSLSTQTLINGASSSVSFTTICDSPRSSFISSIFSSKSFRKDFTISLLSLSFALKSPRKLVLPVAVSIAVCTVFFTKSPIPEKNPFILESSSGILYSVFFFGSSEFSLEFSFTASRSFSACSTVIFPCSSIFKIIFFSSFIFSSYIILIFPICVARWTFSPISSPFT